MFRVRVLLLLSVVLTCPLFCLHFYVVPYVSPPFAYLGKLSNRDAHTSLHLFTLRPSIVCLLCHTLSAQQSMS